VVDYNKSNLRWSHRIVQENKLRLNRSVSSFEVHRNIQAVQGKVGNLPPPMDQLTRVLDYMKNQETTDAHHKSSLVESSQPQEKFLIPQVCFSSQAPYDFA
jgi:hypothetical protein